MNAVLGGLWAVTLALSIAIIVDFGRRYKPGAAGILPRHVVVISTAYVLLATVSVWGRRQGWETLTTLVGMTLGVVALVIVLRREWGR